MAKQAKFQKLEDYFKALRKKRIELSLKEAEEILGFPLCESAQKHKEYWSNSRSHAIAAAWLNAGYKTTEVDLEKERILFQKIPKKPSGKQAEGKRAVKKNLPIDLAISRTEEYFDAITKDPHARFLSWSHCYSAFFEGRKHPDQKTVDYLALHMAFYLASWGMLRSSFLLQKDYRVHIKAVKILLESKYDTLYGIEAEELMKDANLDLVMDAAERVIASYEEELPVKEGQPIHVTDTLVTKILLGALGCVPAYDRYYKGTVIRFGISAGAFSKESLRDAARFYLKYEDDFEALRESFREKAEVDYPPMKIIDMAMWNISYADEQEKKRKEES